MARAFALDGRHHAGGALEVEKSLLKLRIDDIAIRDDDHRREELLVLGVVQVGEEVRRPSDGVGFA